jgi:hypothetical protein
MMPAGTIAEAAKLQEDMGLLGTFAAKVRAALDGSGRGGDHHNPPATRVRYRAGLCPQPL